MACKACERRRQILKEEIERLIRLLKVTNSPIREMRLQKEIRHLRHITSDGES